MRNLISITALLLGLTAPAARADLLQAEFFGTALGVNPACPTCSFSNAPFHATFVFNTFGPLPGPGTFHISYNPAFNPGEPDPLVLARLQIGDPVVFDRTQWTDFPPFTNSLLDWQADAFGNLSVQTARAQGGSVQLTLSTILNSSFAVGVCPGLGNACSPLTVTSSSLVDLGPSPTAVPAPIVGSGLPGVLLLLAGCWAARRRAVLP